MRNLLLIAATLLATTSAHAADIGGITVNGEAAFDYNFMSTKGNPTVTNGTEIPFSGGAQNDVYRLNTTQILAKKETEQISILARFVYNPTTYTSSTTATTDSKANFGTLDQLEVYYKPLPKLYIGVGRFLTTMGYESVLRSENIFYGYSIAFQGITPGYGEGLRGRYVMSDLLTATVSTYNQSAYSVFGDDYTPTKTTEVSLNGTLGDLQWFAGYYFGKDGTLPAKRAENSSSNVWASYRFTENLMAAVMYDSRTNTPDAGGGGWSDDTEAVISYKLWNNYLAVRYEMVRGAMHLAENGVNPYGTADKVNSLTLTDKIALNDNFKVYVEYRADEADEQSFKDGDNNPTRYANMLTLGTVASF